MPEIAPEASEASDAVDAVLRHALDAEPKALARLVRRAVDEAPVVDPWRRRWLPLAAVLLLAVSAALYRFLDAESAAPRRASITNVGDIVILTRPDGEGGLRRSAEPAPDPSGTTLIVRHGGLP